MKESPFYWIGISLAVGVLVLIVLSLVGSVYVNPSY